jgi:hypothetical protein
MEVRECEEKEKAELGRRKRSDSAKRDPATCRLGSAHRIPYPSPQELSETPELSITARPHGAYSINSHLKHLHRYCAYTCTCCYLLISDTFIMGNIRMEDKSTQASRFSVL